MVCTLILLCLFELFSSSYCLQLDEICSLAIVWCFVWFFRNKTIFNNESVSPFQASAIIHKFMSNWVKAGPEVIARSPAETSARTQRPRVSRSGPNLIWTPPPQGFCKLNFDGFQLNSGQCSCGFVLRDADSVLLSGAKSLGPISSILQAEAWGLIEGVRGPLMLDIRNLIIEGDNLSVINAVKSIWKIP